LGKKTIYRPTQKGMQGKGINHNRLTAIGGKGNMGEAGQSKLRNWPKAKGEGHIVGDSDLKRRVLILEKT